MSFTFDIINIKFYLDKNVQTWQYILKKEFLDILFYLGQAISSRTSCQCHLQTEKGKNIIQKMILLKFENRAY